MRHLGALALGLFASTLGGSAFAADLRSRPPEAVALYAAPISTWSGFYAGVQAGAVYSELRSLDTSLNRRGPSGSPTQMSVGGLVGYDHQFGRLVAGVLGDVNARFGSTEGTGYFAGFNSIWRTKSRWDASLRARAGFLVTDRALAYVTAGYAWSDFRLEDTGFPVPADGILGGTRGGLALGAGVEYKLDPNWRLKLEYLHSDFGKKSVAYSANSINGAMESKIRSDAVRLGVNYQFGGPAVAGAPY